MNGFVIPIRSLSRKEAYHIKGIQEDIESCELWLLACGTDSTEAEADAFRASASSPEVDGLIEAIATLSGIMPPKPPAEESGDPKD